METLRGNNKRTQEQILKAFWDKVSKGNPEDCWEWTGAKRKNYGVLVVNGRLTNAHRFVYSITYGQIGEGLHVLHKCDNPPCCNPSHLFLGTNLDNVADRTAKRRHEFGERHHSAKLSEEQVRLIRALCATEAVPMRHLARQYGVMYSTIKAIFDRKIWRHIP